MLIAKAVQIEKFGSFFAGQTRAYVIKLFTSVIYE